MSQLSPATSGPMPMRSPMQSLLRDPGSALTHGFAALVTAAAAPFLVGSAALQGADAAAVVACAVFMLSMLLLYLASTLHHSLRVEGRAYEALRKLDHMMIFVLIAGTYTPVCLTVLRPTCGIPLLVGIWAIAAAGMLFKLCWIGCPKWLSSMLYVAMGWLCVLALPQIIAGAGVDGFAWLLAGGVLYTAGGVLYACRLEGFNRRHPAFGSHEVFHLFVMAGSVAHVVFVFGYLV